jgi:hypothetical protein
VKALLHPRTFYRRIDMRKLFIIAFLAFALMSSTAYSQSAEVRGRVFWRGNVDDRVHLVIQGSRLEHRTMYGKQMPDGVFSFTAALPGEPVAVEALKKKGRGDVTVIQQPSDQNDFTAIVEVYDRGGGAKEYQLEIFWR